MNLNDRAKKIDCILVDVDGTLTDGMVTVHANSDKSRRFCIKDGFGIQLWREQGFKFGFITGDNTPATEERARMLKADYVYMDCLDKRKAIKDIMQKSGFNPEQIAFVGDDLIDIPVFKQVGLAVAVNDGVSEIDRITHYRTTSRGGHGAIREVIEFILKSKNLWDKIIKDFYRD